jgi:hypothetical protein
MSDSPGRLFPKTLPESVWFDVTFVSTSVGGVAPCESIEPGDLRDVVFRPSAECWRLSYNTN